LSTVNTIITKEIKIMKKRFNNANEAYEAVLDEILQHGIDFGDTKAIFNCGFYIDNPSDKAITNVQRNWNKKYAAAEWSWYLSGDPNIDKLAELYGKVPKIWERMADKYGNVNSNYGYQWKRRKQLDYVVDKLRENKDTRHAAISIYDAKEHDKFEKDTPCTYAIQFSIINNKLCMSVYMRSNDVWYGFCNDQYQFASLQEMVADRLSIETGWYYHHAHNMHLYNNKI
jgi:thymidylate synthase